MLFIRHILHDIRKSKGVQLESLLTRQSVWFLFLYDVVYCYNNARLNQDEVDIRTYLIVCAVCGACSFHGCGPKPIIHLPTYNYITIAKPWTCDIGGFGELLTRPILKLRVAHASGMPGTFSPTRYVSDPGMHYGTCLTHVPWCMLELPTSGFLWSWWRRKRSRHSWRMRNPQVNVSGERPITTLCVMSCHN